MKKLFEQPEIEFDKFQVADNITNYDSVNSGDFENSGENQLPWG